MTHSERLLVTAKSRRSCKRASKQLFRRAFLAKAKEMQSEASRGRRSENVAPLLKLMEG